MICTRLSVPVLYRESEQRHRERQRKTSKSKDGLVEVKVVSSTCMFPRKTTAWLASILVELHPDNPSPLFCSRLPFVARRCSSTAECWEWGGGD